jgi:uncharacterized protein
MGTHRTTSSGLRIFWLSALITIVVLWWAYHDQGFDGLFAALILIAIEVTFSIDNAIINAKTLSKLSRFWRTMFLTVGIIIAIVAVRLVLPIVVVMVTSGFGWQTVVDLAVSNPASYGHALEKAYPQIAAFGGAFLLMLALSFFFDKQRRIHWVKGLERLLQRYATFWAPAVVALVAVGVLSILPINPHGGQTFTAGLLGVALYSVLHLLIRLFDMLRGRVTGAKKSNRPQTGLVALMSFVYLEVLDASFSFDSVIGAFAITTNILLIALGLGVGAIWVRSLTVFMVQKGTLSTYRYLEHGAHYTIFILAIILFLGIFWHVPEVFTGLIGIGVIGSAIAASIQANHADKKRKIRYTEST